MPTINKEVKKRALEWVQETNSEFDDLSNRLRKKWLDWWKLYRTFEPEQLRPGQSQLFIPKIYEVIEKKVPGIIANRPSFVVNPRTNEANAFVGTIRETLDFWWDKDKMRTKLEKWVKDALIFGVGFVKVDWKQEMGVETREVSEVDEETNEVFTKEVEEEVVMFEHPTADLVSIFDVKIDPRVENFQQGVGVIQWINSLRYSDLKEMKEVFDLSDIATLDPEQLTDDGFASAEQENQEQEEGINDLAQVVDSNKITICEYWGLFSKSGKAEDEREYKITCVVVDRQPSYVIGLEENNLGFRPFVKVDNRVVRGEFYSISETEPLESLQIEYNNLRNARVDFNNAINYPEWIYNTNANINPANLVHRPNNLIPVDLPLSSDIRNVLRPVDKPQPPVSGINEEVQMNKDFQTISQTIDHTDRGGSQGFTNTATGVKSRDVQIGRQEATIASHLEESIAEVGHMWLALAEAFSEDEFDILRERTEDDVVEGSPSLLEAPKKFTTISRDVLEQAVKRFEVEVEAGSTTLGTQLGKAEDAVNIANTAAQFSALGVPIKLDKIFKDILRDSFQKANPEEFISEQQAALPGQVPGAPQGAGKVPLQPSLPNTGQ
jgi:hypothetical protein